MLGRKAPFLCEKRADFQPFPGNWLKKQYHSAAFRGTMKLYWSRCCGQMGASGQTGRGKEARKNQKTVELKEIWLSMTIDVGDLNVKARQAQKFLAGGNKVKVSIRMRGRQNAHSNLGVDVMNRFYALVGDDAVMEKRPMFEGRNILMILAPSKSN